jgi:hypothetical protein
LGVISKLENTPSLLHEEKEENGKKKDKDQEVIFLAQNTELKVWSDFWTAFKWFQLW